jgi:serine/threonine protein phosphatase PrpC
MNLKNVLDVATRSDTGHVRSRNEDRVGGDLALGVVALADGMGGHHGGDVASTLAVDTILRHLRATLPSIAPGEIDAATGYSKQSLAVRQAVFHANKRIYAAAEAQPEYPDMGTTLVVATFYDNLVSIANVGDSRMYRFRDNQLEQITTDHSLLQELIARGVCTPEQARASLNKNVLTRALGIEPAVAVDMREDTVIPNEIYLLCSDGLSDLVDDPDIAHVVKTCGTDLHRAAEWLVALANENGGIDNVSVVLVRPKKPSPICKNWHRKLVTWF